MKKGKKTRRKVRMKRGRDPREREPGEGQETNKKGKRNREYVRGLLKSKKKIRKRSGDY